jgi:hypothetical protein
MMENRSGLGIVLAALAALSLAAPADARGGHRHHHDDVDAGDVVAGVAIVGGIAAIASAITRGNRERQDAAVGDCSGEAENRVQGHVSEIVNVRKSKGYYTVEGLVEAGDGGNESASFLCTVRNGRIYSFRMNSAAS